MVIIRHFLFKRDTRSRHLTFALRQSVFILTFNYYCNINICDLELEPNNAMFIHIYILKIINTGVAVVPPIVG
jgi:hypothetical protein